MSVNVLFAIEAHDAMVYVQVQCRVLYEFYRSLQIRWQEQQQH